MQSGRACARCSRSGRTSSAEPSGPSAPSPPDSGPNGALPQLRVEVAKSSGVLDLSDLRRRDDLKYSCCERHGHELPTPSPIKIQYERFETPLVHSNSLKPPSHCVGAVLRQRTHAEKRCKMLSNSNLLSVHESGGESVSGHKLLYCPMGNRMTAYSDDRCRPLL